jgi:hypothetical protein
LWSAAICWRIKNKKIGELHEELSGFFARTSALRWVYLTAIGKQFPQKMFAFDEIYDIIKVSFSIE